MTSFWSWLFLSIRIWLRAICDALVLCKKLKVHVYIIYIYMYYINYMYIINHSNWQCSKLSKIIIICTCYKASWPPETFGHDGRKVDRHIQSMNNKDTRLFVKFETCPRCAKHWESMKIWKVTLLETNSSHLKIGHSKRKLVFQSFIFRCYVSFRECSISIVFLFFPNFETQPNAVFP